MSPPPLHRSGDSVQCMKFMEFKLTETEVRVLGSLIEKDITTPDYYPLSLNALVNACNQKSNRDPVMRLDEDAVREALEDVQAALQKLMQREPPLAKVLPRQPGTKESRYAHLLAGDVVEAEAPVQAAAAVERNPADAERIARLEEEVAELYRQVGELKDQLERFRKQFE